MIKRERKSGQDFGRERSEFDQTVLDVRRTARVVAGGRRFTFRATVVIGNRNGKVGLGIGKGADVASAVEKAVYQAKKNVIIVPLTSSYSIPHEVSAKFSSARIILKPSREGRGLVAGGPVRTIAGLVGIKNLTSKIISRTVNKLNNAGATMEALKKLKQPSKNNRYATASVEAAK
ncbi:MAG: 30S ribosomal protein S5 [Candidatus Sungiibacteriota bacterium]|uniref:Small ribosomal subunit protein uS5 n=1 Tax=Candidatus Sungiibacteriota bacterium TaxID=2750080 RepID=A0A7T5RJ30_9BACT|nr:MAG: 30S ribosomal protein S5 [Candidatus Sungbacteria bacterium]